MTDALTVIRHVDRPTVEFPGGATYQPIVGDDTGAGVPIRTGIQTSPPGYQTRLHSHPYVEVLTVLEGRGEAWLEGEDGIVCLEPGVCRSHCRPIGCTRFGWSAIGRSSLMGSTPRTYGSSTIWNRRPPVADPFPSAARRGTFFRSCNQGDQIWPSAVTM